MFFMTKETYPHLAGRIAMIRDSFRNDIEHFEGSHNKPKTSKLKY